MFRNQSPPLGIAPEDERLDIAKLKDEVFEYVEREIRALGIVRDWWETPESIPTWAPAQGNRNFLQATVPLQSSQSSEDLEVKQVLKAKVGRTDKVPCQITHPDTSKQVAKHKFPSDRWERHPGRWIRIQNGPRKSMLSPTGMKDGPHVNDLDNMRINDLRYCEDDKCEIIRDQRMLPEGRVRKFKKRWVGSTIFQIRELGKVLSRAQIFCEEKAEHPF